MDFIIRGLSVGQVDFFKRNSSPDCVLASRVVQEQIREIDKYLTQYFVSRIGTS